MPWISNKIDGAFLKQTIKPENNEMIPQVLERIPISRENILQKLRWIHVFRQIHTERIVPSGVKLKKQTKSLQRYSDRGKIILERKNN